LAGGSFWPHAAKIKAAKITKRRRRMKAISKTATNIFTFIRTFHQSSGLQRVLSDF
jgi:hypothetical protein